MPLTIYKSSAGSGKTYTLVLEYLKIVLANPYHYKNTLAVTFTNKATEEMKQRIIESLVQLSEGKNETLEKNLDEHLPANTDIKRNAQIVLQNILHDYTAFSVSTIDAFFIRIIKSLSRELGLPGKYEVDINQQTAIDEICNNLMAMVGEDKQLTQWLLDYVYNKLDNEKSWVIEKELKKIAAELFKEQYQSQATPRKEKLNKAGIDALHSIKHTFENFIETHAKKALEIIAACQLSPLDFSYGKTSFANYFAKVLHKPSYSDFVPGSRFIAASQNPDSWFGKKSDKRDLLDKQSEEKLLHHMQMIVAYVDNNQKKYFSAYAVLELIYVAGITSYLEQQLKAYRDKHSLFLLTDAQKFLKNIISISDAPFVYEKTGSRYKHFLLDEFQDTSSLQWNNFLPLVENAMAEGNHVLAVGDVKQSIYRWRGADFSLLLEKLENDLSAFEEETQSLNLSVNYRSAKEIVEFNNSLFTASENFITTHHNFSAVAKAFTKVNVEQQVSKKFKGYVELAYLNDEEQETTLTIAVEINKWKRNALIRLHGTIKNLLKNGFKQKDITILVNKNKEGAQIAAFLFANGFDKLISSDSLLIKKAPQVNFVINLLRLHLNKNDEVSQKATQWFAFHYLQEIENNFLLLQNDVEWPQKLREVLSYAHSNLTDATQHVLKVFLLHKSNDSYLIALQDVIKSFADKKENSISAFIQWWDNDRASDNLSVVLPNSEDAIRIMTIHKSKGLQFPIVLMPFFDWDMYPNKEGTLWVSSIEKPFDELSPFPVKTVGMLADTYFSEAWQQELENTFLENLNKMYVALTRPEQQLYLFYPETKEDVKRASQLLTAALQTGNDFKNLFQSDENVLSIVEPANILITLDKNADGSFENPVTINATPVKENFNLSNIGFKISKSSFADTEEIELGLTMHELLAKFQKADDEQQLIEQVQTNFLNNESAIAQFAFAVSTLKNNNWVQPEYNCYCERELINNSSELLRPDRLMLKHETAIVVDYKTGAKEKKHEQQLQQYEDVLMQLGYKQIEKYLLYLSAKELIKVN